MLDVLEDGQPVDLLITDVVLPRSVNGFALARRARMRHHNLKVLYVTAYDDLPPKEAIGRILRKPIKYEQLLAEIRSALA